MRTKLSPGEGSIGSRCEPVPLAWVRCHGDADAAGAQAAPATAKSRVARLARTLEIEVIPRLLDQHRGACSLAQPSINPADVEQLVQALIDDSEPGIARLLRAVQARGAAVAAVYAHLLAPAARQLGDLWEQDRVDFATVTVGLGRLQRLLRQLSPAFGSEVEHPWHGRRILLTQPSAEQHLFGLSMVAEFFRRDGWDVLGGVTGLDGDAAQWVSRDWFDAVGFSVGSEHSLGWLCSTLETVRRVSRNPDVVVLVGGPLITLRPELVAELGADATADASAAPAVAERLVDARMKDPQSCARAL